MTELAATNIALRPLNEPPVTALAESPIATEARDRLLELSKRQQTMGPWSFSKADYKLAITIGGGANTLPMQAGELFKETTSNAIIQLRGMDEGYIWFEKVSGTFTGGELITGQTSGAIRTGGTLGSQLAKDSAWDIADLPDPFTHWLAKETGLDMERQYKMGGMEESVIREQLLRARAEFKEWDAMWGVANIYDMDSVAVPKAAYNRYAYDADEDCDCA